MKRKLSPGPAIVAASQTERAPETTAAGRARRQPQISCDLCRHKKLKCDRTRPCSNCVARGQDCQGGPVVTTVSGAGASNSAEILERLRRLEKAVFSTSATSSPQPCVLQDDGLRVRKTKVTVPSPRPLPTPLTELDYASVGDESNAGEKYTFRLADPMDSSPLVTKPSCHSDVSSSTCILLPAKEDTLAMFEYFLGTSHCIPHTLHVPSTRAAISDFYYHHSSTQSRDQRTADAAVAAFILSFCATAAFVWDKQDSPLYKLFHSVDHAMRQSKLWLTAAWDLLDQSRRLPGPGSLQDVQTYLVLSDLIYNMEGCSPRYRYLHRSALTVAREIHLHLIDATPTQANAVDNDPLTEISRRAWWHLASTDWLLSTMGGALDRTYQVHPRHMMVNYPRNVNDNDTTTDYPAEIVTDMTYFLLRTRLAEVCRKVVDALPLGSSDIDALPYEQVLAISQLFDNALASMPPSFALDSPVRPDMSQPTFMDRQIINLAFHARLARIFRPFLLMPAGQTGPGKTLDPCRAQFRSMCLRSARCVLRIASTLLEKSIEERGARSWPLPMMHRSGCVVNHLFMACVVLATDPKLAQTKNNGVYDAEVESIRLELSDARRVLERVGEQSPMAANLVGKLIGVLKRHSGHNAVTNATESEVEEPRHPEATTATHPITRLTTAQHTLPGNSAATPFIDGINMGWIEQQAPYHQLPQSAAVPDAYLAGPEWNSTADAGYYNAQALDGIEWAALMDTGFTDAESWGQLFADLDAAFPTSL